MRVGRVEGRFEDGSGTFAVFGSKCQHGHRGGGQWFSGRRLEDLFGDLPGLFGLTLRDQRVG